jgi:hypothetical protein
MHVRWVDRVRPTDCSCTRNAPLSVLTARSLFGRSAFRISRSACLEIESMRLQQLRPGAPLALDDLVAAHEAALGEAARKLDEVSAACQLAGLPVRACDRCVGCCSADASHQIQAALPPAQT